jgi:hypothetical protein
MEGSVNAVLCDRCGQPADADRIDVSTWSRPAFVWGRITCRTPGCVDETGSASVDPPDVPGELTREDRRWLRAQRAVADEYARVELRLLREVE